MTKLDLTNKVSPCCKKKITGFNINSKYLGEIDIYRCSYCKGEFTETQILRANKDLDEEIKFPYKASEVYYRTHCSKCNELEKENAKLKVALKALLEQD